MAFVAAPNIIMAEVRCSRNGQLMENRFMVNNAGPVTPTDLQQVAIIVWDWAELAYLPLQSPQVKLNEVVCTDLTTLTGSQYTYAPDSATFGTATGFNLPNEVSLCVSLRSLNRGRSARGRSYIFSLQDSQMADTNNVTSTFATAIAAAFNALITALTSDGRYLAIVSYVSEKAPRVGGPVYFEVENAVIVDTVVDSMKRRKPGIGT